MMPLQIRQVEVFRAVMGTGTVSAAAQLMGISQPAATQLLQALQAATGLRLFERAGGRLRPTPEGQALYGEVQRAFRGLEELDRAVEALRGFNAARLRVGALHALSVHLVPRAIRSFREAQPDTRIALQVQSSNALRDMVLAGRLDLGIVADESRTEGLRASTFYRLPAMCAFAPGHRFAGLRQVGLADLEGESFITLNPEDRMRQRLEQSLQKAGVRLDAVVETPYSSTLCALALEGVGVALVNPLTALTYLPLGLQLRRFQPAIEFHARLVFPSDRPQSDLARRFVSTLRRTLEDDMAALQAVDGAAPGARVRTRPGVTPP